jgi:hypothetical protein
VNLRLDDGGSGSGGSRLVSVLRERFARQYDFIFAGTRRSRRRAEARAFRATRIARFETARLRASRIVSSARIVWTLVSLRRGVF